MTKEDRMKKQRYVGVKVDQSSLASDVRPMKRTRLEQGADNDYENTMPLSFLKAQNYDRDPQQVLYPRPEVFTVSPRPSCNDEHSTAKFNRELVNNEARNLLSSGGLPPFVSNFQQHCIFMSPGYKTEQIINPVAVSLQAKCLPSTGSIPRLQTRHLSVPETSAPPKKTLALILYQRQSSNQEEEVVQLKRDGVTSKNQAIIRVAKNGELFGVVKQEIANVLAPLMDENLIWTEAFIRNSPTGMMMPLKIIIYGPPRNTEIVSTHLYERSVFLSKPPVFDGTTRYLNPHNSLPGGSHFNKKNLPYSYKDYHGGSGMTTTRSLEETKNQIDKVFNSLMNAENIPEQQPGKKDLHQKQALYFLMEREKYNDFTNDETNALTSLWRARTSAGRHTVYYNVVTNDEMEKKPVQMRGGIIADDMGLGKTIQIIALILGTQKEAIDFSKKSTEHIFEQSNGPNTHDLCGILNDQSPANISVQSKSDSPIKSRGTLIVCPLSTVSNWEDQVISHVQQGSLRFYVYHGGARVSDPSLLVDYDIVITTYNVSGTEFSRETKSQIPSALQRIHWFRVVLDEAHIIKDVTTVQSKAACSLKAERRWCLTGTPIQNKADDLFALVKFLRMVPFNTKENWTSYILRPIRSFDPVGISRLQTLMKCITLRRTKMLNGKSLLSLPPRNDHIRYLELNEYERKLYEKTHRLQAEQFKRLEGNNIMQHYVNFLQSLLKMRQICAHFALIKDSELQNDLEEEKATDGLTYSRAMTILNLVRESGIDQCGSCMQDLAYKSIMTKCEHLFCMECATKVMGYVVNSEVDKTTADLRNLQGTITCPSCGLSLEPSDIIEVSDSKEYENDNSRVKTDKNLHSTKVKALVEDLIQAKIDGIKSVVFSQWTRMLDLIEDALLENKITFARLDGTMARAERTQNMENFRKQDDVSVILISLKAGGVGLNLTVAQRVYLMDPSWNPSAENQAIDRIHRLGQTCAVDTVRFIIRNSVEEFILKKQERKLQLAELTLSEKLSKQEITKMRMMDLISLFK
ncbi:16375_t:CDS:10 [Acaulospora morrowiae]|uniref:16375_t:CDS:1 n=1 Tax=Acaulospora morrowiae TaxID=94023 RepID=A0A9N8VS88_9GLOM|nr:16375_t:CDS:10 [Acaulospora morrowiae]